MRENRGEIAKAIGIESVPTLTVGLIASAVLDPIGSGLVLTGNSGLERYANGLIGALTKEGVDVTKPDEIVGALHDTDLMDRVRDAATSEAATAAGVTAGTPVVDVRRGLRSEKKVPSPEQLGRYQANSKAHEAEFAKSLEVVHDVAREVAKFGKRARLSRNQKEAYPQLEEDGGSIVGEGKPGFEGGLEIPPTKVEIDKKG